MPKPKAIDRPKKLSLYVPESLYERMERRLWSELEGRIPFGALNGLFVRLLTEFLDEEPEVEEVA